MRVRPFSAGDAHLYPSVIGVDEAGRGCLAGAVVVCALWFDPRLMPAGVLEALDDSKKLSARQREELAATLQRTTRYALAAGSVRVIERDNIRGATLAAMCRAVERLGLPYPVRVDGTDIPPGLLGDCKAIIKADATIPQVAAASILAKTTRDRLMALLSRRYPGYGWESNAGYGSKAHLEALTRLGVTPHHRRTFRPIADAQLGFAL